MPIFEFKCRSCGKVSEFLITRAKGRDSNQCRFCGSDQLEKILSAPSIVKGGDGTHRFPKENGDCCGITNPCADPKRCCTK